MSVSDDHSSIEGAFQEMKENIRDGQTKDVKFRKVALKKIIQAIDEFQKDFDEANKKDLGINPFMANFSAYSITKGEIQHLIDNLDTWIKPTNIETPVALGLAKSSL